MWSELERSFWEDHGEILLGFYTLTLLCLTSLLLKDGMFGVLFTASNFSHHIIFGAWTELYARLCPKMRVYFSFSEMSVCFPLCVSQNESQFFIYIRCINRVAFVYLCESKNESRLILLLCLFQNESYFPLIRVPKYESHFPFMWIQELVFYFPSLCASQNESNISF